MKIKQDFVTNSSSTSYAFITKNINKLDLYKSLIENKDYFYIYDNNYYGEHRTVSMNVWDLLRELDSIIIPELREERVYDNRNYFLPIDTLIESKKASLDQTEHYILRLQKEQETEYKSYRYANIREFQEEITDLILLIKELTNLKNSGFQYLFEVDFGNDGRIDGIIGDLMRGNNNFNFEQVYYINDDLVIILTNQS